MSKQFIYNDEWWGENRETVRKRWDQWALKR